ncbi:hypothetical protein GH714_039701 [Hevea brasiliensis]|uniref:Glutamate receptor n=1 Tax=Hevea brasiliensis TaxID=3981 RepID=A0A6A6KIV5_HEVBR|nr:hypothetical protein GH714_039701 [Hevea brasiliensis]
MEHYLFCFLAIVLMFTQKLIAADGNEINVGAILDETCRIGKEERVAMQLAIEDFNGDNTNRSLIQLLIRYSHREPFQAALAAKELINRQVKAILGPQSWEESSLVADVLGSKNQIPLLSFSDSAPEWAPERWPFMLQASPNKYAQIRAIVDIVQSWEWHQVTLIYEDKDSSFAGLMPHLSDALHEVGAEISHVLALPPFASSSSSLSKELGRLKRRQCRVFVVHLSFPLAVRLFTKAKKMKMMEKGYVWIATDAFTSLVHSINASVFYSMQGVLGVKGYFPDNELRFQVFYERFRRRFRSEYPEENNHEPGMFAVQAYDAMKAVVLAIRESNKGGQDLLEKILASNFDGLAGKFHFINQKLAPMHTFQIINVMGRSYGELGFWSDGLGFSENITASGATYKSSMKDLGQVLWPGGPRSTPRGWNLATDDDAKPLRIGVPSESTFKQYVAVEFDQLQNSTSFKGYAIELFKASVQKLPFYLPYEFIPFEGKYTDLVKKIHLKKFDAAVGDIAIVANRFEYAEFTVPYTESELVMVVPLRSKSSSKAWLFARPFTKAMWILIFTINVYNGFVVWLIERNHCSDLRGSFLNQMGTLVSLSFTTLFSLQGAKLHSNLSRMAMVVWLFVALIITQTYTANLSTILTVSGLVPAIDSIESLQASDALVGHFGVSFVAKYLEEVLHFKPRNMKNYSSPEDCAKELRNGGIEAVFLEKPIAKLFLARFCWGFAIAGPSFKVGGFAFAFAKGSPLLHEVTEALVKVTESGELQELEKAMIGSQKCVVNQEESSELEDETFSLSPSSFWMLFIITGGTSTLALLIYVFYYKHKIQELGLVHGIVWMLMYFDVVRRWKHHENQLSRAQRLHANDHEAPSPRNSSTTASRIVNSSLAIDSLP